jgi:hypothetical protein
MMAVALDSRAFCDPAAGFPFANGKRKLRSADFPGKTSEPNRHALLIGDSLPPSPLLIAIAIRHPPGLNHK